MNFWASWCAECRVEHGALAAAWDRYRDQGVVLLGVPFQDRSSASAAYVDKYGGDWPQLTDPDERTALAYGVYGVPGNLRHRTRRAVAAKRVGAVSYQWVTDQVERLLPKDGR